MSKNLDEFLSVGQTGLDKLVLSNLGQILLISKLLKDIKINWEIFDVVDVLKSSLRNTTLQRHLTTFETNLSLIARASLCTLMSTGRCTAKSRTRTTTDTTARMG